MRSNGLTNIDLPVLRAVLDCIIPPDADPGAVALGVDQYVVAVLTADRGADAPEIARGLAALASGGFLTFDSERQTAMLRLVEAQPWFGILAELAAEGFYADPGNGGNREAGSWAMLGYEPRLPGGPGSDGGR